MPKALNNVVAAEKVRSKQAEKMRRLRALVCGDRHERAAYQQGATAVAGVDEVGRGALFGPVVAAAVILPAGTRIRGVRDSKQLEQEERERLYRESIAIPRRAQSLPETLAPLIEAGRFFITRRGKEVEGCRLLGEADRLFGAMGLSGENAAREMAARLGCSL